jgi:ABC-type polysaccharide/polyol phosphate export permease
MRADLGTFYAWFSSGLITWLLISSTISSSVTLFRVNRGQMLNIDLPYSFYAYKITTVHLINFAFNLPIFLVVSLIVYQGIHIKAVLALFGVAVLFLNGIWANMFFGLVAARYKILAHLVPTVMPALFLFTPVMWLPENLGDHAWVMNFNPFMHYVALVREPLMGKSPPLLSVVVACLLTAAGFLAAHLAYRRWRRTIIFYA